MQLYVIIPLYIYQPFYFNVISLSKYQYLNINIEIIIYKP